MFIATLRLKTDEFSNERGGRFFPVESRQHPDQQWGPPLSVQKEACRCRLLTCSPLLHSTGWLRQPESSRTGPGPETHAPWHHRVPDTLPPWVQLSPLQGFHPLLWGLSAAARAAKGAQSLLIAGRGCQTHVGGSLCYLTLASSEGEVKVHEGSWPDHCREAESSLSSPFKAKFTTIPG